MNTLSRRIAVCSAIITLLALVALGLVAVSAWRSDRVAPIVVGGSIIAIVAVFAGAGLATLLAREETRAMERLRQGAQALAAGAQPQRLTAGGSAELRQLLATFNDTAESLYHRLNTLDEERARLQATLAATVDALLAVDAAGVVRYANPPAEAQFGKAVGRTVAEVVRRHEVSEALQAAIAGRRYTSPPFLVEPRAVWLQAEASPIPASVDWAALLIIRDVSEVRRAEITRREFVANVSHELRTPLAGLKAVVETLRDGALEDPAAAEEFLSRADAEVDRLVHLVDELLQLARLEAGMPMTLAPVDVAALLASVGERFAHQAERAGVSLDVSVPGDLPAIVADEARLGQATGNLVHNALKFTPAGGCVRLSARVESGTVRPGGDDSASQALSERRDEIIVEVSDTGVGIDQADLPRVFERFYVADRSRSRGGTGLGLAIVKHVALAHGGSVEASSTLGVGSTFRIHLPIIAP